jgi:hypothetical protein
VLVYAANASDPASPRARQLVDRLAQGPELLVLFWPVLMGFLRIATNAAVLPEPLAPQEALSVVADLVHRPHVRTPAEQAGFLALYAETAPSGTRGALVPDAHLATLMRQHGVTRIYTRDRGFRRFDGIRAVNPFA